MNDITLNSFINFFYIDKWVALGFFGQLLFFSRMIIQWIHSEKHKKSLIPIVYWYLSLIGGIIVFTYALHRKDPVFYTGQFIAIFIYGRNLILTKRNQKQG